MKHKFGIQFPTGAMIEIFSFRHRVQNGSGAHPASYPMGTGGFYPGKKRPKREADHLPPCSVEVKNAWSYTTTPQCVLMAWRLVRSPKYDIKIVSLHNYHATKTSWEVGISFHQFLIKTPAATLW